MLFVYNMLVYIAGSILKLAALFNEKLSLFVRGRKGVFTLLKEHIKADDKVIWFHAASLGEFEQGLPVMEQTRRDYPSHKIVLTFFSPSGYEVRKNTPVGDVVCYLPLDTRANAKRFLDLVHPELVVFVKYEFWPNYLKELHSRNINTLLISAIFRPDQAFFKGYGKFMRSSLKAFTHMFVQDEGSEKLLQRIGFNEVTVSGDTRFDRVGEILLRDNNLEFMERFKGESLLFVAGSTWPEDEEVILPFLIKDTYTDVKYVIAPHNIKPKAMAELTREAGQGAVRYTAMEGEDLAAARVLILDTIGVLTKVYSYADIAYVGGGMGSTGLHNTLEPAVFGIPVITGPHYKGFREAELMVENGGITVIDDKKSFERELTNFIENEGVVRDKGEVNKNFIEKNRGAVIRIMDYIRTLL
ncbi:3-deoxy-D-manno-octulosonic acid transferase [Robertkochia sediminum]|uniref:3-deoxy-D-manno-octulosonic acid transferase n=1 Tax=Robertkochia sediminum TaxID=2785326 RepID=UPI0019318383|nr:glycosyltransferase N-terminal domain-containing protein [Robertkochia sediminum]MBL7473968.1 3-deoxy-D-manno-octulosonic acid transferase [Robertkochia sediminum]